MPPLFSFSLRIFFFFFPKFISPDLSKHALTLTFLPPTAACRVFFHVGSDLCIISLFCQLRRPFQTIFPHCALSEEDTLRSRQSGSWGIDTPTSLMPETCTLMQQPVCIHFLGNHGAKCMHEHLLCTFSFSLF